MDDLGVNLTVVLVTGVVLIGIFIITAWAKKRQLQQVETFVRQNDKLKQLIQLRVKAIAPSSPALEPSPAGTIY